MRLFYFGRLADVAGTRGGELVRPSHVTTVGALIDWIEGAQPELAAALRQPSVRAIVDDAYADRDAPLSDACELSFVPPVSGG